MKQKKLKNKIKNKIKMDDSKKPRVFQLMAQCAPKQNKKNSFDFL